MPFSPIQIVKLSRQKIVIHRKLHQNNLKKYTHRHKSTYLIIGWDNVSVSEIYSQLMQHAVFI